MEKEVEKHDANFVTSLRAAYRCCQGYGSVDQGGRYGQLFPLRLFNDCERKTDRSLKMSVRAADRLKQGIAFLEATLDEDEGRATDDLQDSSQPVQRSYRLTGTI
jgi:hypothetical protein